MTFDPQWILAICAVITLVIFWSATVVGVGIWLMQKLKELKDEILADFKVKHEENSRKVQAMEVLVMRHDLILEPEFNGTGKASRGTRQ